MLMFEVQTDSLTRVNSYREKISFHVTQKLGEIRIQSKTPNFCKLLTDFPPFMSPKTHGGFPVYVSVYLCLQSDLYKLNVGICLQYIQPLVCSEQADETEPACGQSQTWPVPVSDAPLKQQHRVSLCICCHLCRCNEKMS